MSNTHSSKGTYILAALVGAAVGGSIVALSTRALPNMMSGMMDKCKGMMAGMGETSCGDPDMCKRVMAEKEQAPQRAACQSQEEACHAQGGSCHGSD